MTARLREPVEGDAVHFVSDAHELPCRAATIIRVTRQRGDAERDEDGRITKQHWIRPDTKDVDLSVLLAPGDAVHFVGVSPSATSVIKLAKFGESHEPGSWHWKEECKT